LIGFNLYYSRARHVLQEAERSEKIINLCDSESTNIPEDKAASFGKILEDSQNSYEKLFDSSSDQIRKLIEICKKSSKGARIAGTGWGGSCICLIKRGDEESVIENIMNQYYLDKSNKLAITDDLKMYVFSSSCTIGACIIDPNYELWF
jgi:galactokinase